MNPNTARTIARVIAGFLAGVMILSLLLSLVGCGQNPEVDTPVSEEVTEETPETEEEKAPETEKPAEDVAPESESENEPEQFPSEEEETPAEPEEIPEEPAQEPAEEEVITPDEAPPVEQPVQPEEPAVPSVSTPDANGMMQVDGSWIQDPGPLNTASIDKFAAKLQNIRATYLGGAANVVWSIIPDKSNFAQDRVSSYLDHASMVSRAKGGLSDMTYVEIDNTLSLDSYLLTDGHWRQEAILPAANKLASAFGFSVSAGSFITNGTNGFGGDYAKHSGTTEPISWLESTHTKATVCDNFQNPGRTAVYDPGLIKSNSPYDLFAGGPTPLVTLKNSAVTTGKRLILFRDSFGSSMAPLLLEGYSEIVLVDLRYMASNLLPQYVDANGADVLFLFSARVVNNSTMLR